MAAHVNKTVYDHVVIGSSIAALAEAIHLARLGKQVLVVEKEDVWGGAWSTIDIPGFSKVEFGAHLIANYQLLYRQMNAFFHFEMMPLASQPLFVANQTCSVNNDWVWLWMDCKKLVSQLGAFQWHLATSLLKYMVNYYPPALLKYLRCNGFKNTPFHYPRQGTYQMVATLIQQAQDAGVQLSKNTTINAMSLSEASEPLVLESENGDSILTQQVVIPTNASIPVLKKQGQAFTLPTSPSYSVTLFLVFECPEPTSISYIHFHDEPLILRVSDITSYAECTLEAKDRIKLFAVQMHPGKVYSGSRCFTDEEVDYIFKLLKRQGMISPTALFLAHYCHTYQREVHDWPAFKKYFDRQDFSKITLLDTTTLSDSLLDNFPRWRQTFKNKTA